ncbi:MAG: FtsW/RodA/SpoVE family cell cycle protein [Bacillota bacterium]
MARTIPAGSAGGQETTARAIPIQGPDGVLLFALVGLISVGMIMVYSATVHEGGFDVTRRILFQFGMGAAGLLIGLLMPFRGWRKVTPLALVLVILTLASLLVGDFNPLAHTAGGATRWLKLGSVTVQPSEFAKLAFILFAANFLEKRGPKMKLLSGYGYWGGFLAVLGLLAVLIYLEPDLGTALVLGGIAFCMLWASGVDWKAIVVGLVLAAVVVAGAAMTKPHQRDRLKSWWNPWIYQREDGHQVIQSWMALARGGWWGVGLGQSLQKLDNRLPEAETDFIFAVIAEELGLVRATGVILFFLLFAWRGYAIAARAPDRYTGLLATGVTSWIAVQAGINIGVVTGTVPNTGVPLPFISSGGSSLLALLMAVGILIAISRRMLPERKEALR